MISYGNVVFSSSLQASADVTWIDGGIICGRFLAAGAESRTWLETMFRDKFRFCIMTLPFIIHVNNMLNSNKFHFT